MELPCEMIASIIPFQHHTAVAAQSSALYHFPLQIH
jgi:hypothetical protein